jgi:hypothetical protein
MSDKPSYLGLLNAIAVAEGHGHALLAAWRDATPDPDLAATLNVVAIREQEHAAAFTKRLCELGYGVREKPNPEFQARLAAAGSSLSDADKFREVLGYDRDGEPDPLERLFDDHSIDAQTGALLGRFIAEERDSERRLRSQWARIRCESHSVSTGDDAVLNDIAARIDRLSQTIEELKRLRR